MQLNVLLEAGPLVALAAVLTTLFLAGSVAALAFWVYRDASARNANGPLWWTLLALSGFGLLAYLVLRGDRDPRERAPTRADRLASTWTTATLLAFVVGAVVTPPDPFAQVVAFPPLFVAAFAATHLWTTRVRPATRGAET